jgi:hypothetical protein
MDSAFSRYERRTELNEGLATYVQLRAAGRDQVDFPAGEWRPAEVRLRAYTIGPAIAFLLDRFAPGWQPALDAHDAQFLDVMLAAALEGVDAADSCDLPAAERAHLEARARDDAAAVVHDREARRRAFDALPGWRLLVTAAAGKRIGTLKPNFARGQGGSRRWVDGAMSS